MKTFSKEMKSAITRILKKHEQLEKFNTQDDFHLRLEMENFLPLVIEKHNQQITITHYRTENGELIADPDMEFLVGPGAEWYPVALQIWNGSYYRARWSENGKDYVNLRQVREQLSFAKMWAKNLKDQGWWCPSNI